MIADYHIHTPYCGHAHGKTVEYIEQAIDLGLDEICFTDHLGRYYLTRSQKSRYWDWGMHERNITRYVAELAELRTIYQSDIIIKIGLEVDYVEGAEELLLPFLNVFPFDVILGSIHCLPRFGWRHLADIHGQNVHDLYTEYFRLARAALQSPHIHSLAHLDFIWRYIPLPAQQAKEIFEREIAATLQTAKETGKCIEINANSYIWSQTNPTEGVDPFVIILSQIRAQKVPITLGSDAHDPRLVGKSFDEIIAVLRSWDIKEITCFTEGTPFVCALERNSVSSPEA